MEHEVELAGVDWRAVTDQLATRGWARLPGAVASEVAQDLETAAAGPWSSLPETEGSAGVRQAGRACHSDIDRAAEIVRSLAEVIRAGIDSARIPGVPPLPVFNHAQWCRAEDRQKYITPHRDPDTAGGVIAVVTLRGQAPFRAWETASTLANAEAHAEFAHAWETGDGDVVLLCGGGWPTSTSRCPIHEAQSPLKGDRVTLTLRHNKGGYGSDYFD